MPHESLQIDESELTSLMEVSSLRSPKVVKLNRLLNVSVEVVPQVLLNVFIGFVKQFLPSFKVLTGYKLIGEFDRSIREKSFP